VVVLLSAHAAGEPSDWVRRWAPVIPAPRRVLDLACGSGRHVRWLHAQGCTLTAVDRDATALAGLQPLADTVVADLEAQPWPLPGRRFEGVVVTNYLWRPLWPHILASLAAGGALLYETFADGQQLLGRPSRPEFLLQPAELLARCAGLHVLAFEQGRIGDPGRVVQRIVALAPPVEPASLRLDGQADR
jgi:SAM-dependent methyltransferase